jgi:hypothetical protein
MKNIYESILLFFILMFSYLEGAVEFMNVYKKKKVKNEKIIKK